MVLNQSQKIIVPSLYCLRFKKSLKLLQFEFLKYNLVVSTQFGFQKNHSTNLALTHLQFEHMINKLDNNFNVGAIFMDLVKAFDTINHKTLLNKQEKSGTRGAAKTQIKSYLTNHEQMVGCNGFSSSLLDFNIGVLQGSVLDPAVPYNIFDDLEYCSNFKTTLYANGNVLTLCHKNIISL